VGCKGLCDGRAYRRFYKFYLNYVGCKGKYKDFVEFNDIAFYLNYVGCKVGVSGALPSKKLVVLP